MKGSPQIEKSRRITSELDVLSFKATLSSNKLSSQRIPLIQYDTIANSNYQGLIAVHCSVMINLSGGFFSASYLCCGRLLIDGLTTLHNPEQPRTTQLDYIDLYRLIYVHIKPKGLKDAIFLTQCEAIGGASATCFDLCQPLRPKYPSLSQLIVT